MQSSFDRVRAVIKGELPDRAPLYELLRNDAVVSHFAGETLTIENAEKVVFQAYAPAVDATRPLVRLPERERTVVLEDGRQQRYYRWTIWEEQVRYNDGPAYVSAKRDYLDNFTEAWNDKKQADLDRDLASMAADRKRLGEVFFFPWGPGPSLQAIYGEVGLEHFSYYLADYPHVITEVLECDTLNAISWIEHLSQDHGIEAIIIGDDIAFNSGPLLSPKWFADHYFGRLARVTSAYHKRGIKVLFHSDGNLNPILDGLVEAGIDGLNPIEVLAGMNIGDIHCRYPHLFLAGGIDVSQLLPFGKPQEVKDAVRQAIDVAEGRIMIGSTTELNDEVPLANYLALREAVFENRY